MKYIGQPDIGDSDAQNDGVHSSRVGWNDPKIKTRKLLYETLLMRRNVAILMPPALKTSPSSAANMRTSRQPNKHIPFGTSCLKEIPRNSTIAHPGRTSLTFEPKNARSI